MDADAPAPLAIRALRAPDDIEALGDFYRRAEDYVRLEWGRAPDARDVEDFLDGAPPGIDPASSLRCGAMREGQLVGIAEMAFGYPRREDAYIGLLLLDPAWRGRGLGRAMVAYLFGEAQARGAGRMLVAVLDANPRGRAFWEREGFRLERSFAPGPKDPLPHLRHRLERRI